MAEEEKPKAKAESKTLIGKNAPFLIAAFVIIIVAVYFRIPMLHFYGFYEPDGYYHYSVIRAAVENNLIVPKYLSTSGWPAHTTTGEPHGLYWITLLPYAFLSVFGVSYYTIMRLIPVLFGLFAVIGAYFLSRYLSRDKLLGLLAMLFVALSMGNAARTSALIYRGDSFVAVFLIVSLIFAIEVFRTDNKRRKIIYMLLSGFFLSVCNAVWNGAPFAVAMYVFAFALILLFGFGFDRKKLIDGSKHMLGSLLLWYLLVSIYEHTDFILGVQTFTGIYFFILFFVMLIGWYFASYFSSEKHKRIIASYIGNSYRRFAFAIGFLLIAVLIIYTIIPNFVYEIFVANGFIIMSNFGATIQELQPPSPQFLYASFGLQTYTTPMSLMVLASSYFTYAKWLFWVMLLILSAPYFFMRVYDSGGFASGNARIIFEFDEALLVLISYFALTAYLQMHAIRFNSLISIPLAIFGAYTVYWLMMYAKRYKPLYLTSYVLVFLLIISIALTDTVYIQNLFPADNINPIFIQALAWLKNNSASNSVVLTLWPDGSVVEGVANLTSVTDSVASQNATKANPFAAWLYNSSPDPQFLLSSINGKPDYLLVRSSWLLETGGIFTEAGITTNSSQYGYNPFMSLNEKINSTVQTYIFCTLPLTATGQCPGLTEETVLTNKNGTQSLTSYLILGNNISPFGYVAFYDETSGNFSMVKQTSFNATNNQTFLITYSDIPNPSLYINITSAYMLNTGLANSNMIKFLYFCDSRSCLWNNNIARLALVYVNPDTKIFRIIYNASA